MFGWLLGSLLLIGAPAPKDARKPVDPPAGEWRIERLLSNGEDVIEDIGKYHVKFTATTMDIVLDGMTIHSLRIKCFSVRNAYEIDIREEFAKDAKEGIYQVNGDTLTICEAAPGKARPIDFISSQEKRTMLWVLKRTKK
jgi:uncharacterized protein (TIGR03067 family)